jgi:integrase
MTTATLTLAEAARIMDDARMRDDSYLETTIGQQVERFLARRRWEGFSASRLKNTETVLSRFSLDHAHLELGAFAPPGGTERVIRFMDHHWGTASAGTRGTNLSILRTFLEWCVQEGMLAANPAASIRRPKDQEKELAIFAIQSVRQLLAGQPRLRDRVALMLLFDLGLRKNELRQVQFKHFTDGKLTIFGKGGKVRRMPIAREETRLALERHILEREAGADEYLLYPEKVGRIGSWPNYTMERIWEDRSQPLSPQGVHGWWYRCLERAELVPKGTRGGTRLHSTRHTAGTEVLRATGNLEFVRRYMRHASIASTVRYLHYADEDFERELKEAMASRPTLT